MDSIRRIEYDRLDPDETRCSGCGSYEVCDCWECAHRSCYILTQGKKPEGIAYCKDHWYLDKGNAETCGGCLKSKCECEA